MGQVVKIKTKKLQIWCTFLYGWTIFAKIFLNIEHINNNNNYYYYK